MYKVKNIILSIITLLISGFILLCSDSNAFALQVSDGTDADIKEAYLTFDDGPSFVITDRLLDVLKEYGVKSTFFVVGKEIQGKEDILKRIYNEGHGIGLHTYSHNFSKIYKSNENFLQELEENSNIIESTIGYKPSAVRFPGGSDLMLNPELLKKLHEKNYKVFDWNVNLEDGVNAHIPVSSLLNNAKKIKGNRNRIFILAHCNSNNKNTYKALPYIIQYYQKEGFQFKTIGEDTIEYHYRLKKVK